MLRLEASTINHGPGIDTMSSLIIGPSCKKPSTSNTTTAAYPGIGYRYHSLDSYLVYGKYAYSTSSCSRTMWMLLFVFACLVRIGTATLSMYVMSLRKAHRLLTAYCLLLLTGGCADGGVLGRGSERDGRG